MRMAIACPLASRAASVRLTESLPGERDVHMAPFRGLVSGSQGVCPIPSRTPRVLLPLPASRWAKAGLVTILTDRTQVPH